MESPVSWTAMSALLIICSLVNVETNYVTQLLHMCSGQVVEFVSMQVKNKGPEGFESRVGLTVLGRLCALAISNVGKDKRRHLTLGQWASSPYRPRF